MRYDFDPDKDATILSKHGLSLAAAAGLSWDAALAWVDNRADYGEVSKNGRLSSNCRHTLFCSLRRPSDGTENH